MPILKPHLKKWVTLSAFLGFAIFLIYLYNTAELAAIIDMLIQTNIYIYALAFSCVLAAIAFNALTLHSLLHSLHVKIAFRKVFLLGWIGIFIDSLVPGGWTGDIFKAYLLIRDHHTHTGRTAASIIIKNLFEMAITLVALVVGLILLAMFYQLNGVVLTTIGITMLILAIPFIFIFVLSSHPNAIKKIIRGIRRLHAYIKNKPQDNSGFEAKMENTLKEYSKGLSIIKKKPKMMFKPMIYQVLAWAFDIISLFLIFASIGYIVTADKVIITQTMVGMIQAQGFALAGFAQVVSSSIYTILGISPLTAVASTLLAGFATYWFKIAISFAIFQYIMVNRNAVYTCKRCSDHIKQRCKTEPCMHT